MPVRTPYLGTRMDHTLHGFPHTPGVDIVSHPWPLPFRLPPPLRVRGRPLCRGVQVRPGQVLVGAGLRARRPGAVVRVSWGPHTQRMERGHADDQVRYAGLLCADRRGVLETVPRSSRGRERPEVHQANEISTALFMRRGNPDGGAIGTAEAGPENARHAIVVAQVQSPGHRLRAEPAWHARDDVERRMHGSAGAFGGVPPNDLGRRLALSFQERRQAELHLALGRKLDLSEKPERLLLVLGGGGFFCAHCVG